MDTNKQKILERVAKCFALAKDAGAAPNEAEIALRQARKLMQQRSRAGYCASSYARCP